MSSLQKIVCDLFNLPNDEFIYDDFSCAIHKAILLHGRLFITEKNLCFYADIFGIKTKVINLLSHFYDVESLF